MCDGRENSEEEYAEGFNDGYNKAVSDCIKTLHVYWTTKRIRHSLLETLQEDFEQLKEKNE